MRVNQEVHCNEKQNMWNQDFEAFTYMHEVHFIHINHAKNFPEDIYCTYLNLFDYLIYILLFLILFMNL